MSLLKNRITAVLAGSALLVGVGATGAVAGDLIGSRDIRDDSIRSIDLNNDGVNLVDLDNNVRERINNQASDNRVDGIEDRLADLEDRVAALETAAAAGINTNWVAGAGATIVNANTVVLDSRNTVNDPTTSWDDANTSEASIDDLNLPVRAGSKIQFTYELANGAAPGWGAPRVQIVVDGVRYSSAHQINPDYGTENADGTFTVRAVATSMNDNSATQVPVGSVTRAVLAYDNVPAPGTVEFTNLSIDGQPISFK